MHNVPSLNFLVNFVIENYLFRWQVLHKTYNSKKMSSKTGSCHTVRTYKHLIVFLFAHGGSSKQINLLLRTNFQLKTNSQIKALIHQTVRHSSCGK